MLMQVTGLRGILFIKKPGNVSFFRTDFSIVSKPFIKEYYTEESLSIVL